MHVEVGLLGPVELRVDGVRAGLGGRAQRILLARLALAAGRVVPAGFADPIVAADTGFNLVLSAIKRPADKSDV